MIAASDIIKAYPLPKSYGIVYLITNMVNGKVYVGQTIKTLQRRWTCGHVHKAKRNRSNTTLARAINKYGPKSFKIMELARAKSKDELDFMERYWIKQFRSMEREYGYNMKEGGARGVLCREVCDRIAKTLTGRKMPANHPWRHQKCAPMKGRKKTPEQNAAQSEMVKARIAAGTWKTNKGKVYIARRHPVVCVETGERFDSRRLAAAFICPHRTDRENRGVASSITQAAKSGKAAHGYHWREAQ